MCSLESVPSSESLSARILELENEVKQQLELKSAFRNELETLQTKLVQAEKTHKEQEEALKQMLEKTLQQLVEEQQNKLALEKTLQSLQQTGKESKVDQSSTKTDANLQKQLENSTAKIVQLEAVIQEKERVAREQEKKVVASSQQNEKLQQTVDDLTNKLTDSSQQIEKLQQTIDDLTNKLTASSQQIEKLHQTVDDLTNKLEQSNLQKQQLQQLKEAAEFQLNQFQGLNEENQLLQQQLEQLQQQYQHLLGSLQSPQTDGLTPPSPESATSILTETTSQTAQLIKLKQAYKLLHFKFLQKSAALQSSLVLNDELVTEIQMLKEVNTFLVQAKDTFRSRLIQVENELSSLREFHIITAQQLQSHQIDLAQEEETNRRLTARLLEAHQRTLQLIQQIRITEQQKQDVKVPMQYDQQFQDIHNRMQTNRQRLDELNRWNQKLDSTGGIPNLNLQQ